MASGFKTKFFQLGTGQLCKVNLLRFIANVRKSSTAAFVWGAADGGQLGTPCSTPRLEPVRFATGSDGKEVTSIGCGHGFTVIAPGKNHSSQLLIAAKYGVIGRDLFVKRTEIHSQSSKEAVYINLPESCIGNQVTQISCGRDHVTVLTSNGDAFVAGSNNLGQCGGSQKEDKKEFYPVLSNVGEIRQVECGLDHTLFLTAEGKVFSCGMGADGQTGLGHFNDEWNPTEVVGDISGIKIKQVSSSADCCLAVSEDGEVFSWGNNEYGQLANGSQEPQFCTATRAVSLQGLGPIVEVAAAGAYCVVLTEAGDVYSWGFGVLGHGSGDHFSRTPKQVIGLENIGERVLHLCCGIEHAAVITENGQLLVWGRGSYGRLGNGKTVDQWTPNQVRLPGRVLKVSCGVDHMGAIVELSS